MKKIVVQFNDFNITARQYDQCWDELRAVGQSHPEGLIHHYACQRGSNFAIVDIWESREAFDKFSQVLRPILNKLNVREVEPLISEVYYEYEGVEAGLHH